MFAQSAVDEDDDDDDASDSSGTVDFFFDSISYVSNAMNKEWRRFWLLCYSSLTW